MSASHIHYRVGDSAVTQIPLGDQDRWLTFQEDGEDTIISIFGPRGSELASVRVSQDLAEVAASALLRKGLS